MGNDVKNVKKGRLFCLTCRQSQKVSRVYTDKIIDTKESFRYNRGKYGRNRGAYMTDYDKTKTSDDEYVHPCETCHVTDKCNDCEYTKKCDECTVADACETCETPENCKNCEVAATCDNCEATKACEKCEVTTACEKCEAEEDDEYLDACESCEAEEDEAYLDACETCHVAEKCNDCEYTKKCDECTITDACETCETPENCVNCEVVATCESCEATKACEGCEVTTACENCEDGKDFSEPEKAVVKEGVVADEENPEERQETTEVIEETEKADGVDKVIEEKEEIIETTSPAEEIALAAEEKEAEEEKTAEAKEESEEIAEITEEAEETGKKAAFKLTPPKNLEELNEKMCTKRGRKLIFRPSEAIYDATFKVEGTDKKNEEGIKVKDILDAEIKQGVKLGYIDKFDGLKTSEIKEEYENDVVYEYAEQEFKKTGLIYDGGKIKVYVYDFDGKACHHVGYIDENAAAEVIPYLIDKDKYSFALDGIITGGKAKRVTKDENGKITVTKEKDGNIGLEVDVTILPRKD